MSNCNRQVMVTWSGQSKFLLSWLQLMGESTATFPQHSKASCHCQLDLKVSSSATANHHTTLHSLKAGHSIQCNYLVHVNQIVRPNPSLCSRKHINHSIFVGSLNQQEQPPTVLKRIPLEIFFEILNHYEPVPNYYDQTHTFRPGWKSVRFDALNSMALVCRDFSVWFQPLLFETAWMGMSTYGAKLNDVKLLGCSRFAKAIVDGNYRARVLAMHVKRYVVGGPDLKTNHWNEDFRLPLGAEDQHLIFSRALCFMPNVREVHISQHSITDELLRAIVHLPSLLALRLDLFNVPQPLDEGLLQQFAALEVKHMLVSAVGNDTPAEAQFFSHLSMSQTETLTGSHNIGSHIFKGLSMLPAPMQNLTYLEFERSISIESDDHQTVLLDAIRAMPALTVIHLDEITHSSGNAHTFRPHSYPSPPKLHELEYIHAHLPVLEALVPGSNVTSIGIANEVYSFLSVVPYPKHREFWERLAVVFNKSQQPINSLNVPMLFYTSVPFADRFPGLRYLILRPTHRNWVDDAVYTPGLFVDNPSHVSIVLGMFKTHGVAILTSFATNSQVIQMLLHCWPRHPDLIDLEFVFDQYPDEVNPLMTVLSELFPIQLDNATLSLVKEKFPALQWLSFAFAHEYDERDRQDFFLGEDVDINIASEQSAST